MITSSERKMSANKQGKTVLSDLQPSTSCSERSARHNLAALQNNGVLGTAGRRRYWRRFMNLGMGERLLFLKLCVLLTGVAVLVRWIGYRRTRRLLEASMPPSTKDNWNSVDLYTARVLGHLTCLAGRVVPVNGTCLRQSLLVWWLLRLRGFPAELHIGVRKYSAFEAHAWVELASHPVNDVDDIALRFSAFEQS